MSFEIDFNPITIFQQKDSFLKIVEELRHTRNITGILESKVQKLQEEKSNLENEVETLIEKNKKISGCCEELKKEKLSFYGIKTDNSYEEENRKLKLALEASELTIDCLKKSIISYKSTVHSQENKLNEYKQKFLVAQQSSIQVCNKIELFRVEIQKINKLIEQVTNSQENLQQKIDTSLRINQDYCHSQKYLQQCLCDLKQEKEDLFNQVIELSSKVESVTNQSNKKIERRMLISRIDNLSKKNDKLNEEKLKLEIELQKNQERLNVAVNSLKEMHGMINNNASHINQANQFCEDLIDQNISLPLQWTNNLSDKKLEDGNNVNKLANQNNKQSIPQENCVSDAVTNQSNDQNITDQVESGFHDETNNARDMTDERISRDLTNEKDHALQSDVDRDEVMTFESNHASNSVNNHDSAHLDDEPMQSYSSGSKPHE